MSLMKESLNSQAVTCIADAFLAVQPNFDYNGFVQTGLTGLGDLELKQRVQYIIDVLHQYLPADFTHTAVLFSALADQHANADVSYPLNGFTAWPVIDYISVHGLQHPQLALDLLKRLTHLFSAEFAIRPFILLYPELTYSQFHLWLTHNSEHVRRLVSEGSRPRLPWGMQLKPVIVNPDLNIVLLNKLKQDPSLYVRRSVANHLNDIGKDHPLKLIELCQNWYPQADDKLLWIIRHATRSLVKAGHPGVFPLLGYTDSVQLSPVRLVLQSAQLTLGQKLVFSVIFSSLSEQPQKMVVDFAIHFVKANGQRKAKVFKLANIQLAAKDQCQLHKKHGLKAITTRRHYAGTHQLEILINGQSVAMQSFELRL